MAKIVGRCTALKHQATVFAFAETDCIDYLHITGDFFCPRDMSVTLDITDVMVDMKKTVLLKENNAAYTKLILQQLVF